MALKKSELYSSLGQSCDELRGGMDVTASQQTDMGWLTCVLAEMELNQYSESSAQPGLSIAKLLNLDFVGPPTKDEQSAIAAVLSEMDAELAGLEQRREKTRALKQAMVQKLLTGRTRLA